MKANSAKDSAMETGGRPLIRLLELETSFSNIASDVS